MITDLITLLFTYYVMAISIELTDHSREDTDNQPPPSTTSPATAIWILIMAVAIIVYNYAAPVVFGNFNITHFFVTIIYQICASVMAIIAIGILAYGIREDETGFAFVMSFVAMLVSLSVLLLIDHVVELNIGDVPALHNTITLMMCALILIPTVIGPTIYYIGQQFQHSRASLGALTFIAIILLVELAFLLTANRYAAAGVTGLGLLLSILPMMFSKKSKNFILTCSAFPLAAACTCPVIFP